MGLLFAFALLCIPLALALWDLSSSGDLTMPRRHDGERGTVTSAGHSGDTGHAVAHHQTPVPERGSAS